MTTSFYDLTVQEQKVSDLVTRYGNEEDKEILLNIVTAKAKMVVTAVSMITLNYAQSEYSRLSDQFSTLLNKVVSTNKTQIPIEVLYLSEKVTAKVKLIDPAAFTPDNALINRSELQTLLDHLSVYKDACANEVSHSKVFLSDECSLLRKRINRYIFPKGVWSNGNVASLWRYGYSVTLISAINKEIKINYDKNFVTCSFRPHLNVQSIHSTGSTNVSAY